MSRLYPCVYCTEDGYCEKYSDDEVTTWCVQSPCKDERQSHADKIRAMSDEELAEWIGRATNGGYGMCAPGHYDCTGKDSCAPCWLDWLKQEAKDDKP